MWIEFIGLPAVGKTTWIKKNIKEIEKQYKVVTSSRITLKNSLLTRLYYFRYYFFLKDKKLIRHLCYRLSFRPIFRGSDIFFYDSGLIQVVLENLIETNFKDQNAKISFLRKLRLPELVLYMKDVSEKAVQNELNREGRLYHFDELELEKRYEKASRLMEKELLPLVQKIVNMRPEDQDIPTEVIKT